MTQNRRQFLTLALALPALGACSVIPERPYVETSRFPLLPRRASAMPAPARGKVLLIRMMRAAPGLDQRGLRSLRPDGTEKADYYAEWASPPADAAEEAVRRWLGDAGIFAGIVSPGTRANYDLVLEIELSELIADTPRGEARAGIAAVLVQEAALGGKVLMQATPRGRAPLPPGERAADQAAAMTAALGQAIAGLEEAVRPYA
ncbi:membrane integrity-associated transporter subunit PqiC [Acetobacteraceae bacterium H6797]|nr:membrane integrity-associated transporter subunit PqiC [Acetobacteraceae bacterium H6797]